MVTSSAAPATTVLPDEVQTVPIEDTTTSGEEGSTLPFEETTAIVPTESRVTTAEPQAPSTSTAG